MKKFLLIFLACFYFACNPGESPPGASNSGAMLNVLVYDSSGSANWIAFNRNLIAQILAADSLYSAVFAAGIAITSNSRKQTPPVLGPIQAGFEPLTGNKLHQNGIAAKNQAKHIHFYQGCTAIADSLAKYLLERPKSGFTDVNGGLALAEMLCKSPRFSPYSIRLIITSDFLQTGSDRNQLKTFHFPANVTIYVVGSAPEIDLKTVFPDNPVIPIPSIHPDFLKQ
jgi:hypothetical protein